MNTQVRMKKQELAFLLSTIGQKSQNIVVTHPSTPYLLSPFFKTFVTHPPKINELDTAVTATPDTTTLHKNICNVHLDSSKDNYVNLLDSVEQPLVVHKIKTILLSISLPKLRELESHAQESTYSDYESVELYRVSQKRLPISN